jgi:hypothetical protein
MGESKGTSDEDIGRPGPWGEGRYQKAGDPVETSVRTPPGTLPNSDAPVSTSVTRKDYESKALREQTPDINSELPGGDAG